MNRLITSNETELVIKRIPQQKTVQDQMISQVIIWNI